MRDFAETDGDGVRDTRSVAISDFGAATAGGEIEPVTSFGATGAAATGTGAAGGAARSLSTASLSLASLAAGSNCAFSSLSRRSLVLLNWFTLALEVCSRPALSASTSESIRAMEASNALFAGAGVVAGALEGLQEVIVEEEDPDVPVGDQVEGGTVTIGVRVGAQQGVVVGVEVALAPDRVAALGDVDELNSLLGLAGGLDRVEADRGQRPARAGNGPGAFAAAHLGAGGCAGFKADALPRCRA